MSDVDKAQLLAFCRADAEHLLREVCRACGLDDAVPAAVLVDVFEVLLKMRVAEEPLEGHQLGRCEFVSGKVLVNQRMREITLPNTKVEGVVNSTLAHELGHVRLGHERELRQERDLLTQSLFEVSTPRIVCFRNWERRRMSPEERIREAHANLYASVFLVPQRQLMSLEEARLIETCWREGREMSSRGLWELVLRLAEVFQVTGALMARRLCDLGWLVQRERSLAINEQAWLPLPELQEA